MFNIGDYVTRKSYNNDIVFKIIDIRDNIYYLKGVNFRLYADSPRDDLEICEDNLDGDKNTIQEINREYDHLSKVFI